MSLKRVEELLRVRIGLDPSSAGLGLIARAVKKRLYALGLEDSSLQNYAELVEGSSEEFENLVEEVVVPESWFFRDELPFIVLANRAAKAFARGQRTAFRVLSMPCASGEEPYSAAIALVEKGVPPWMIQVDAVDLSHKVLERARQGVYSCNAFRSADLSFRDRHFVREGDQFSLVSRVSSLVRFRHANLVCSDLLAGEAPYHAIFCRNVLIYLDPVARAQVIANIHRLLATDGVLFVGHAEQLGLLDDRFQLLSPRGSFAFERNKVVEPPTKASRSANGRHTSVPSRPTQARKPQSALSEVKVPARAVEPVVTPARAVVEPAAVVPPLEEATRLANAGKHGEALQLCEREISLRGPSAAAFALQGVIRQAMGDRSGAEGCFEKAVYLDARHEEALLALAVLAQRRGDATAAANYRRRAERAFKENPRP